MKKSVSIVASISAVSFFVFAYTALDFYEEKATTPESSFADLTPKKRSETQPTLAKADTNKVPSSMVANIDENEEPPELPSAISTEDTEKEALLTEVVMALDYSESVEESLSDRFDGEDYDTDWAAKVENETWEEFYAAGLADSDIDEVQCKSSLCKIAVSHQDVAAEETFKRTLLAHLNGRSGYFEDRVGENGERSTILYRFR